MAEENKFQHKEGSIDHALKIIKRDDFAEIYNNIFDILKLIIEKYKELKQASVPIIQEQSTKTGAPFYDLVFDFTEFINILSTKSMKSTRFTDAEIMFFSDFLDKYINNAVFVERIQEFGRTYVSEVKDSDVFDPLMLEMILAFFDNSPDLLLELKICIDYAVKLFELDVKINFFDEDTDVILRTIQKNVTSLNSSIKNPANIKNQMKAEIDKYGFAGFISEDKFEEYYNNWFENDFKKSLFNEEEILRLIETRLPRPLFKYEIKTYAGPFKGLVNFFKEVFGFPVAKLFVLAYPGTSLSDKITHMNKNGTYSDEPTLEMFNISNDISKLYELIERLFRLLDISKDVLAKQSIEKITILKAFAGLDYEMCNFISTFFTDIKKVGIITSKVKVPYFAAYTRRSLSKIKATIITPVSNYFSAIEDSFEEKTTKLIKEHISKIPVEIAGIYVNLARLEEIEEIKKNRQS
jgi:hypothetical protein